MQVTVKSLAAPLEIKPGLPRKGSERYRPQFTSTGTSGRSGTGHESLRPVQGVGAVQATSH